MENPVASVMMEQCGGEPIKVPAQEVKIQMGGKEAEEIKEQVLPNVQGVKNRVVSPRRWGRERFRRVVWGEVMVATVRVVVTMWKLERESSLQRRAMGLCLNWRACGGAAGLSNVSQCRRPTSHIHPADLVRLSTVRRLVQGSGCRGPRCSRVVFKAPWHLAFRGTSTRHTQPHPSL